MMANFSNFPAATSVGQEHAIGSSTYIVENIGTDMAPILIWTLQSAEFPIQILTRADIILSEIVTTQTVLNPVSDRTYIVYDVTQIVPGADNTFITRELLTTAERFFMGLDVGIAPFLTHTY